MMRMPVAIRPCSAPTSPRSFSVLSATIVLLSRERHPCGKRLARTPAERRADAVSDADGENYLSAACDEHSPAHLTQLRNRDLDTNGEEQQDDAEFGKRLDISDVGYEPQRLRANHRANYEIADERRQPDETRRQAPCGSSDEDDDNVI